MAKLNPTKIDKVIGRRIGQRREAIGVSLESCGDACGVTHEQMRNYIAGRQPIHAGRLALIAAHLGVPMQWFVGETADNSSDPSFATIQRIFVKLGPDQRKGLASMAETLAGKPAGRD